MTDLRELERACAEACEQYAARYERTCDAGSEIRPGESWKAVVDAGRAYHEAKQLRRVETTGFTGCFVVRHGRTNRVTFGYMSEREARAVAAELNALEAKS